MFGGQKTLCGRRRQHKSRRDHHPRQPGQLAQVCHLVADKQTVFETYLRKAHNERPLPGHGFSFDDLFQAGTDRIEDPLQLAVAAGRHGEETADHLVDVDQNGGDFRPDDGHPVRLPAVIDLLQIGHGLQGVVVGGEQAAEMRISLPEAIAEFFVTQLRRRRGKKAFFEVGKYSQHTWSSFGI